MQLDVGREVHGREKYQGGEEGCGNRVFLRKKKKRTGRVWGKLSAVSTTHSLIYFPL